MLTYQKLKLVLTLALLFVASPSYAQVYHPDVTFKDSLVHLLFQYGREVFYRGVDPQEASYVFQRIILLDCRHSGAIEFLGKIRKRYPNVSIKISDCSEVRKQEKGANDRQLLKGDKEFELGFKREDKYLPSSHVPAFIREDASLNVNAQQDSPVLIGSQPITDNEDMIKKQNRVSLFEDNGNILEESRDDAPSYFHSLKEDCNMLRSANLKLQNEILELNTQIRLKDAMIVELQDQLTIYKDRDSASFASIAEDQQNLIRIQQGNIDYLQKELDDVKDQVLKGSMHDNPDYLAVQKEIATAQLLLQEKETLLEAKNKEAFLLQKQLGEFQEQLRLVKKILVEKNEMIESLQEEIESIKSEGKY